MKIKCLNSKYGGLLLKNIQLTHSDVREWGNQYSTTDANVDNLWFYDFFNFQTSSQPELSNFPLSIYNNGSARSPLYLYTTPEGYVESGGARIEGGVITSLNNYNHDTAVVRRFFSPFNINHHGTITNTLVNATSFIYTGASRINTITTPQPETEYANNEKNTADHYDSYTKLLIEQLGYLTKTTKTLQTSSYERVSLTANRFYLLHFTSAAYEDDLTVIFAHNREWFSNSSFNLYLGRDLGSNFHGILFDQNGLGVCTGSYTATYTLYELPLSLDMISVNNSWRNIYPGTSK